MLLVRSPGATPGAQQGFLAFLQISTCHQLLHPQVLQLLVKLFETEHSQLDVMEQVSCRERGSRVCGQPGAGLSH